MLKEKEAVNLKVESMGVVSGRRQMKPEEKQGKREGTQLYFNYNVFLKNKMKLCNLKENA